MQSILKFPITRLYSILSQNQYPHQNKYLKYSSATLLMLVASSELLPNFNISKGLLLGQGEERQLYFLGKIGLHIIFLLVAAIVAIKLIQSARKSNKGRNK